MFTCFNGTWVRQERSHRKIQVGFKVICRFSWWSPKMFSELIKICWIALFSQTIRFVVCGVGGGHSHSKPFLLAFQDGSDSWLRVWLQGRRGGAAEERRRCQGHRQSGPWCISLRSPQQEPRPDCNCQNPLGRNHQRSVLQHLKLCLNCKMH